ncbi:hypothetical protein DL764_004648 [Monosporascus ibericus]|uniref:Uncharacterized protein n=1 Tax=Monosporascus ibericus TaxID=155417 RepID=A0A4V1XAW3_9PEZI|nr:hypothetical protein DL764_004648 [Monosporascus ibericus]
MAPLTLHLVRHVKGFHKADKDRSTFLLFLAEEYVALEGFGRPWKDAEVRSYRFPASEPLPEDRTPEHGPTRINDGAGAGGRQYR